MDRIHTEYLACDGQLLTPVKHYTVSRIRVNPDSFDREVIRQAVHSFYEKKEFPTLDKIVVRVKERLTLPRGRFRLWRVLKPLGSSYRMRDDKQYTC